MTGETVVTATTEDGLRFEKRFVDEASVAEKPEAALENLCRQLGKHTGPFAFSVASVEAEPVRFYPASFLNGIRRELADELLRLAEARPRHSVPHAPSPAPPPTTYRHSISRPSCSAAATASGGNWGDARSSRV